MVAKESFSAVKLLAIFTFIRFVFAYFQRSSFHPDEHWQGPEVAYRMIFGSTEKTWEWFDTVALRSHLHPLIFAIFFKLVSLVNLDFPLVIAYGPRFVQGCLTAVGDLCFYLIGKKLFGVASSALATTFYITSWFSVLSLSRTTSNAADAAITLIGIYYLVNQKPLHTTAAASVCFLIRPPSAIFWLPICISIALTSPLKTTMRCLGLALNTILGVCALDRIFYGVEAGWLAPWNFLSYNVLMGVAKQYGEDPWWSYLSAIPLHYLLNFPFVIYGLNKLPRNILIGLGLSLATLSYSGHKELRFISPLFAVLSLGAGSGLTILASRYKWLMMVSILVHAGNGTFQSRWRGLGADRLMTFLRAEVKDGESVFFLGCHQTPLRYYLHRKNVKLDYLDCSPLPVRTNAVSDRDSFFQNPEDFLTLTGRGKSVKNSDWVIVERNDKERGNQVHVSLMKVLNDTWGYRQAGPAFVSGIYGTNAFTFYAMNKTNEQVN